MANTLAQEIPGQLRAELARRQITKSDLASRLNVSDMWLYRRLSGNISMSLEDLDRITAALEIDPRQLLERAA